mgnify:CR=1 FL=1
MEQGRQGGRLEDFNSGRDCGQLNKLPELWFRQRGMECNPPVWYMLPLDHGRGLMQEIPLFRTGYTVLRTEPFLTLSDLTRTIAH